MFAMFVFPSLNFKSFKQKNDSMEQISDDVKLPMSATKITKLTF